MAFFRDPSTGIQSFGIQSFASAESGHANCGTGSLPGAVDRRIAWGNCGNPIAALASESQKRPSSGARKAGKTVGRIRLYLQKCRLLRYLAINGGWGGIRTHGALARTPVFKTGALNRSATHPGCACYSVRASGYISDHRHKYC
jgi:hypothetical protein